MRSHTKKLKTESSSASSALLAALPRCLANVFTLSGPQCYLLFSASKGLLSRLPHTPKEHPPGTAPSGSAPARMPTQSSQPPLKDTHWSHEAEIQQAYLLSRTQLPFLLLPPRFSSTTALNGPVCSPLFITQGEKDSKTSCRWKSLGKHRGKSLKFHPSMWSLFRHLHSWIHQDRVSPVLLSKHRSPRPLCRVRAAGGLCVTFACATRPVRNP